MSPKTLMIALLTDEGAAPPSFLRPVLDVAETHRAHVAVVAGAHQVKLGFAIPYPPAVGQLTEENERRLAAAQSLADAAVAAGKNRSVEISGHVVDGTFDDMIRGFSQRARVHDLVVAATPGEDEMFSGSLASALLFETGRPVLFMPSGFSGPFDPATVVIAWDGGQRAARAVGDAMPFIEAAKRVSIVTITGDKDLSDTVPAGDLAAALSRHNRNVTLAELPVGDGTAGDVIIKHAATVKAGLMIMGAYAHARWRELVLGGVTRTILQSTPVPVLMAH